MKEPLKKQCEYCYSECTEDEILEIDGWKLCGECYDAYDNKTGYCSLDCCISGRCDESC